MSEVITKKDIEVIEETITVYSTKYTNGTKYYNKGEAIYASITHDNCPKCNTLKDKFYIHCDKCSYIIQLKSYKEKPLLTNWNYPIYSDYLDKYFFNEDELFEYLEEYKYDNEDELDLKECMFYSCLSNTLPELDYYDLDEDLYNNIPNNIHNLLDELNKAAKNVIISYCPDYRYQIKVKVH